jgi:hypothetical protein
VNDRSRPKAAPETAGERSTGSVSPTQDTEREPAHVSHCVAEFVTTLIALGRSYGDIPLYGSAEWAALDRLDPRRFASVVRAAECWRLDGTDEVMRDRLADELADADMFTRWRVREAGLDVHGRGSTDWARIHEVVTNRAAYRQRCGVSA